jgi:hypothetical protein
MNPVRVILWTVAMAYTGQRVVEVSSGDQNACLRRDAIRSQVIEAQEIKETGNEED